MCDNVVPEVDHCKGKESQGRTITRLLPSAKREVSVRSSALVELSSPIVKFDIEKCLLKKRIDPQVKERSDNPLRYNLSTMELTLRLGLETLLV